MLIDIALQNTLKIKTSTEITQQLMVCSHERSGTHLTMNTLDHVSHYCSKPWLNYDLNPLGGKINFSNPLSTGKFIEGLSALRINNKSVCNASILKSHFPISHLGDEAKNLPLKIIYIWRDPTETIISLWKFMHRWGNEGPQTKTPLELATARPSGQSQRYQASNYRDYFERWAMHVIEGINYCKKNPKAFSISYEQLLTAHTSATEHLCTVLDIEMLQKPCLPSKTDNVIQGLNLNIEKNEISRLRDLCNKRLEDFPSLKEHLEKTQKLY